MKISQLLQVVLVSSFVAVPGMAASPAVGSDAPVSLCGDKAEKAEKTDKDETTVKSDKKNEKKENKADKTKGAA